MSKRLQTRINTVNKALEQTAVIKRLALGEAYDCYQLYTVSPTTPEHCHDEHLTSGNARHIANYINHWLTRQGLADLATKQPTYKVIRFFKRDGAKPRIIRRGVSYEVAKAHCNTTITHEPNLFFDGYNVE